MWSNGRFSLSSQESGGAYAGSARTIFSPLPAAPAAAAVDYLRSPLSLSLSAYILHLQNFNLLSVGIKLWNCWVIFTINSQPWQIRMEGFCRW